MTVPAPLPSSGLLCAGLTHQSSPAGRIQRWTFPGLPFSFPPLPRSLTCSPGITFFINRLRRYPHLGICFRGARLKIAGHLVCPWFLWGCAGKGCSSSTRMCTGTQVGQSHAEGFHTQAGSNFHFVFHLCGTKQRPLGLGISARPLVAE